MSTNELMLRLQVITCGAVLQTLHIVIGALTHGKFKAESAEVAKGLSTEFMKVCEVLDEVDDD